MDLSPYASGKDYFLFVYSVSGGDVYSDSSWKFLSAAAAEVLLTDSYVGAIVPQKVAFEDINLGEGSIAGSITITFAADEADIDGYKVYYDDNLVSEVKKGSANVVVLTERRYESTTRLSICAYRGYVLLSSLLFRSQLIIVIGCLIE